MARESTANIAATRVDWVDIAKGICIVLVVMLHSTLGVEKAFGETGWMHWPVAFARPFRMPDFFLLSGLFLAEALRRDVKTYLDRRVVHFAYFYFLWSAIHLGLKIWPVFAEAGAAGAGRFVLRSLFWDPIGAMWFLYMLALFSVAARSFRRAPLVLWAVAAGLHLAAPAIVAWVERHGVFAGMVHEFCRLLVFFVTGWLAAPAVFRLAALARQRRAASFAALGLWAVLNGAAVFLGWAEWTPATLVLGMAGAVAVVAAASLLAERGGPIARALRLFGERSLAIYLAFFLPMAATRAVLVATRIVSDIGTASLLVTIAAVVGPLLLFEIVRRAGIGAFLFERPAWARLGAADEIHRRSAGRPDVSPGGGTCSPGGGPPTFDATPMPRR